MRFASLTIFALAVALVPAPAIAADEAVVVQLPGTTLGGSSARWGEWIADVERPQSAGTINKVDSIAIKQKVVEDNASKDMVLKGSTIGQNSTVAPGVVGRGESIENLYFEHDVKTARESGSGLASGKRGQDPVATENGSVIVRLTSPWPGCAAGDRFNGAYLTVGSTHRYRLDGLRVARCSSEEVAFVYATVVPE